MASTLRRRRKTPAYLATEGRKHASKQRSTNFSHGEVHMTQKAELELPEEMVGEPYLEESSPFPSVRSNYKPDSLVARNAAVFEIVPTENISRVGIQMVTQKFWEPDELVLVSSPPGFFVQGSVVYCKKLPSDDHLLGIRLDAPVEHWSETLGPAAS